MNVNPCEVGLLFQACGKYAVRLPSCHCWQDGRRHFSEGMCV